MAASTYKCPSCGGYLAFDPDTQQWKCPFCDSVFDESVVLEKSAEAKKGKLTKEQKRELKAAGINRRDKAAVEAYFAEKERIAAEEAAKAQAEAEEAARLEREANPTAEDLLKKIIVLLENK